MTKLFVLRKKGSDPKYPWELRDLTCPSKGEHSFSGYNDPDCDGRCDAFSTGKGALAWLDRLVDLDND